MYKTQYIVYAYTGPICYTPTKKGPHLLLSLYGVHSFIFPHGLLVLAVLNISKEATTFFNSLTRETIPTGM